MQAEGVLQQPGDPGALVPWCIAAHQAAPMVPRDAPHHPPQPPQHTPRAPQDLPPAPLPPSCPHPTDPLTLPRQLPCSADGATLPSLNVEIGFRQPSRLQRPPGRQSAKTEQKPKTFPTKGFCGGFNHQYGRMGGRCGICGDPADAWPRQHEVNFLPSPSYILPFSSQSSVIHFLSAIHFPSVLPFC